ncbi:MAG: hypothetical protein K2L13_01305, partial [Opitutales bacterium]|nr:hypothetical protein [Opitutales bacterium]
ERNNQEIITNYLQEVNQVAVGAAPDTGNSYPGTTVGEIDEPASMEFTRNIETPGEITPIEQENLNKTEIAIVDEYTNLLDGFTAVELRVIVDADGDGLDDALDQKLETSAQTATKLMELREKCSKEGISFAKIIKAIAKKLLLSSNSSVNGQVANLFGNAKAKGLGDISFSRDDAEGSGIFKIGAMDS